MFFFLVKYPFISEINANTQNPLKSPFEEVNYYMGLNFRDKCKYPKSVEIAIEVINYYMGLNSLACKNRLFYRLSNITAFFCIF